MCPPLLCTGVGNARCRPPGGPPAPCSITRCLCLLPPAPLPSPPHLDAPACPRRSSSPASSRQPPGSFLPDPPWGSRHKARSTALTLTGVPSTFWAHGLCWERASDWPVQHRATRDGTEAGPGHAEESSAWKGALGGGSRGAKTKLEGSYRWVWPTANLAQCEQSREGVRTSSQKKLCHHATPSPASGTPSPTSRTLS